jgi:hypothetical protein
MNSSGDLAASFPLELPTGPHFNQMEARRLDKTGITSRL